MAHLALLLAALQAVQAPPAPQQGEGTAAPATPAQDAPASAQPRRSDAQQPQSINHVQFVVNDQVVTFRDFVDDLRRDNRPYTTPQERDRAFRETFAGRVRQLLMEQGGRELGYEEALIKRYVDDEIQSNIKASGGIVDLGEQLRRSNLDPTGLREMTQRGVYAQLWGMAVEGQQPKSTGRLTVDRYMRPGRILFEFERAPLTELAPGTVDFQNLFISAESSGGVAAAKAKAEDAVAAARAGRPFTELVRERSQALTKAKDGWERGLALKQIETALPEVYEFLATAAPGDISAPIGQRRDGELIGFVVLASVKRAEPMLDFDTARTQEQIRRRLLASQGQYRRDRELTKMLEGAYVWPPEMFGQTAER